MNKTLKKIYNIVTTALVVLVVIIAILLVGVRIVGLTPYTVLSPSMTPTYPVGSVLYVSKVSADELKVGDPLTYTLDGKTVTHRIVEKNENDLTGVSFITKGDANKIADGHPVYPNQIVGKPLFHVPVLGYISNFVQTSPGIYIAAGGCLVLVFLAFLPDFLSADKKKKEDDVAETEAVAEEEEKTEE